MLLPINPRLYNLGYTNSLLKNVSFNCHNTGRFYFYSKRTHRTIFAIGISRISSAPAAFRFGISSFTSALFTTVSTLK